MSLVIRGRRVFVFWLASRCVALSVFRISGAALLLMMMCVVGIAALLLVAPLTSGYPVFPPTGIPHDAPCL